MENILNHVVIKLFDFLIEFGVLPEIGKAVDEMDWMYVFTLYIITLTMCSNCKSIIV